MSGEWRQICLFLNELMAGHGRNISSTLLTKVGIIL